jgi:hypothetical protein
MAEGTEGPDEVIEVAREQNLDESRKRWIGMNVWPGRSMDQRASSAESWRVRRGICDKPIQRNLLPILIWGADGLSKGPIPVFGHKKVHIGRSLAVGTFPLEQSWRGVSR